MIKLLRIDDRLIHGRSLSIGSMQTGADTICHRQRQARYQRHAQDVLNRREAGGSKMEVLTVAKAVDYLNNAANAKRKILLICGSCEDAETLCAGAAEIKEVDLGGIRSQRDAPRFPIRSS